MSWFQSLQRLLKNHFHSPDGGGPDGIQGNISMLLLQRLQGLGRHVKDWGVWLES